ncbi:MAG: hypothetical protein V3W34_05270 [Phycisphaerae bacterium]
MATLGGTPVFAAGCSVGMAPDTSKVWAKEFAAATEDGRTRPDFKVNVSRDALFTLDALQGFPYPFTPGNPYAAGLTRAAE